MTSRAVANVRPALDNPVTNCCAEICGADARGGTLASRDREDVVELGPLGRIVWDEGSARFEPASGIEASRHFEIESGVMEALRWFLRGHFMLHASCVAMDGRAFALAGKSRAGKSTLAASLVQRGASLVSDGMTLFDPVTRVPWTGSGVCKLSDESIRSLGLLPGDYPTVNDDGLKRYVTASGKPLDEAPVLTDVYVVMDGADDAIESLAPNEQVVQLIANGVLASKLSSHSARKQWERALIAVRGGLRVHRLVRQKDWSRRDKLVELVMTHFV